MHTEQILAASGAAYVTAVTPVTAVSGGSRWSIGNDAISKTLEWQHGRGLCLVALENRASDHAWRPDLQAHEQAGGEFSLRWDDATLSGRQASVLHAVHATTQDAVVTLQFELRLGSALDVTLFYQVRADTAVIEQWLTVTPLEAGTLSRVAPATVSVDALPSPVAHWVRGLQGHGAGMPGSGLYPAFRLCHQPLGTLALESGLRSTWHEIAWLALAGDSGAGEGLFSGLLYSGRWSARAQVEHADGATLTLFTEGYAAPLAAREQWTSPGGFVGVYKGDLDDAAHVQHTYMRNAVVPATPDDFPWVQYNTWFAHLVDIDETILRREAELAARLGAEVFVIDAGWWEPSLRTSDNFTTGLGRWQPSAEKFPSGIPAFAAYVRSLGLRFGIWVEPERVDLRQPATWRLDWLVRHHDAIVSPSWPPDTVSGWLCFGHPDVQAWALDWISRLVGDLDADWLKWDSNWWGVCTCTNHGHNAGDGEFYQVQGVHAVLSELRRRFPNLMIENCAGGGTRTDFAMLANTHATWLHDASTPSHRVRFHLAGASYLFPPELCNTFVVDADDESLADPNTPRPQLDAIARSRMLGAFGVSARLMDWTDVAFTAVQAAIVHYKEIRPLLKRGRFYHLLPQPDLACPDLALHGQWEAYAIIDHFDQRQKGAGGPSTGMVYGALWVFRAADAEPTTVLQLRGLAPDTVYQLVDVDAAPSTTPLASTGAHWMQGGITLDLGGRTSALILIRPQEDTGKPPP